MFRRALTALLLLIPLAVTAAPLVDFDTKPRLGVDYEILPTPQPTYGQGKIEVAEVFSYACIHCAHFQPVVDAWLKNLPADVRYEYVPAVFGPVWERFARAFLAAKLLGVQPRTHSLIFKAVHEDHVFKTASLEEIADWYASHGVNRQKFLATMNGPKVDAMIDRAKQFALSTGIQATPTLILAGKYRLNIQADRGFEGLLRTADFLLAQERAAGALKPGGEKRK